jgi:hypothetical protein
MENKMNIELLQRPNKSCTLFQPTPSKVEYFAYKLLNEYLYVSDEFRTPEKITNLTKILIYKPGNIWYELPNFGGMAGFIDIIPGYRCFCILKLWNQDIWGATLARDLKQLVEIIMNEFKLVRVSAHSADKKMEKLAHLCGFKTECAQKYGFQWDGKLYPLRLLAITKSPKK